MSTVSNQIQNTTKFNFFKSIYFTLGTDFVMHNTKVFDYTNNSLFDFVVSTASNTVPLWLLQNPNSKFAIRQGASSIYHVNRLLLTACISTFDYGVSGFFDAFHFITRLRPNSFQEKASLRFFKRLMLVLRRNGGVYEDLFEILSTFYRTRSLMYDDVLNSPAFYKIDKSRMLTFNEMKKIIEKELSIDFDKTFSPIRNDKSKTKKNETFSLNYYKDVTSIDCCLKESPDINVSISVIPPHLQRMRNFDIFTLKLLNNLFGLIPFMDTYSNLFSSVINRLDWNMEREKNARIEVLKAFDVDLYDKEFLHKKDKSKNVFVEDDEDEISQKLFDRQANSKMIRKMFQRSREIVSFSLHDFISTTKKSSLYVPAPIPSFCSDHVMVTDIENHDDLYLSNQTVLKNLVLFTTQFYRYSGQVIPNLSTSNVSIGYPSNVGYFDDFSKSNLVSLRRFGSLVKIDKNDVKNSAYIYAGYLLGHNHMFLNGTKHFGIRREVAKNIINHIPHNQKKSLIISGTKNNFSIIAHNILQQKPDFAFTAAETMMSLAGHLWDTMELPQKAMSNTIDIFGSLFIDYSLKFIQ